MEFRHAARRLLLSPGFAALAIGTLTVGIGINAAMFALMDALLLRPPAHVAEPREVVRVRFRRDGRASPVSRTHFPNFTNLQASGAFSAVAAYSNASVSVGVGPNAHLARAMLVSDEFFRVLRPTPVLGGLSLSDSGVRGAGRRVVISYGFWQRHFGGEPGAVGARLTIDGNIYSVGGILPSGFPNLGAWATEAWIPLGHVPSTGFMPSDWRENDRSWWLAVIGRLAGGVSRDVAEQRATAVLDDQRNSSGERMTVTMASIVPGRDGDRSLESRVSRWLAGVSAVVLLIACANVSSLVLARGLAQRREFFIRRALGASRWDGVRRSWFDTCMILAPSALGAVLVSFVVRNVTAAFLSGEIPLSRQLWDVRVTALAAGSALLAFILLWLSAVAAQPRSTLTGSRATTPEVTRMRGLGRDVRRAVVFGQAALSFVLLCAAVLFSMSLRRAESLDLGVDIDHVIQLTLNFTPRDRVPGTVRTTYERAVEVLRMHPDVEGVALAGGSPYMAGSGASPWTSARSREELWSAEEEVAYRSAVGPGFFSTVGAHSLRGRDFNAMDRAGAPLVSILNAPLARHLWPNEDALGQCLWLDEAPTCVQVVGVLEGVWKFSALRRDITARGKSRGSGLAAAGSSFVD